MTEQVQRRPLRVHLHVPFDHGTPLVDILRATKCRFMDRLSANGYVPAHGPTVVIDTLPGGLLATAYAWVWAPQSADPVGSFPAGYDPVSEAERLLRDTLR